MKYARLLPLLLLMTGSAAAQDCWQTYRAEIWRARDEARLGCAESYALVEQQRWLMHNSPAVRRLYIQAGPVSAPAGPRIVAPPRPRPQPPRRPEPAEAEAPSEPAGPSEKPAAEPSESPANDRPADRPDR